MGETPKQTFLQRRRTDSKQTHEKILNIAHYSVQFSSVAQSCPTLCDPVDCGLPGFCFRKGVLQAWILKGIDQYWLPYSSRALFFLLPSLPAPLSTWFYVCMCIFIPHLLKSDESVVNNSPANGRVAGDAGSISGSGRSLWEENVYPLQYSCLENSVDRGAWWATVHGVTESWTWLRD